MGHGSVLSRVVLQTRSVPFENIQIMEFPNCTTYSAEHFQALFFTSVENLFTLANSTCLKLSSAIVLMCQPMFGMSHSGSLKLEGFGLKLFLKKTTIFDRLCFHGENLHVYNIYLCALQDIVS